MIPIVGQGASMSDVTLSEALSALSPAFKSVDLRIVAAKPQNEWSNVITSIFLSKITWFDYPSAVLGPNSNDTIASNTFNVTISNSVGTRYISASTSYITESKGPYCYLWFESVGGGIPADWWATIGFDVYLRNE